MRTAITTHPALATALCLSLVIPTACNKDSDATPPPTTTTSPSPTPSTPTPSKPAPPTLPPSAKGLTPQSATAFTHFYLHLLDHAKASQDLTPLRTWSDKGCLGCTELINGYSRDFSAGGSYSGDFSYKNIITNRVHMNGTRAAELRVRASVGRHSFIDRRGSPTIYPGEAVHWRVALTARGAQWIVYEIEDEAG